MGLNKTNIGWCTHTWNPIVGCSTISEGCWHCYARKLHNKRHFADWKKMKRPKCYAETFEKVRFLPERLNEITPKQKPAKIFVCSMSDLFHKDVEYWQFYNIYQQMLVCNQHTFQILTKRADRMNIFVNQFYNSGLLEAKTDANFWLGVTIENNNHNNLFRLDYLLDTPAAKRFVSFEPLLSEIIIPDDKLKKLDQIIVGCESGKNRRKSDPGWISRIVRQCLRLKVPVYLKQQETRGKVTKKGLWAGKDLHQFPK